MGPCKVRFRYLLKHNLKLQCTNCKNFEHATILKKKIQDKAKLIEDQKGKDTSS